MAFYDQALDITYHIVTKYAPYYRKMSQACPDLRGMETDPHRSLGGVASSPFFLGHFLSLL